MSLTKQSLQHLIEVGVIEKIPLRTKDRIPGERRTKLDEIAVDYTNNHDELYIINQHAIVGYDL